MNTTLRLTTLAAVEAYLHEIASYQRFDATNHTGRYAYMFGAATVLISDAHSQIERLEREVERLTREAMMVDCPICENVYDTQAEADACCANTPQFCEFDDCDQSPSTVRGGGAAALFHLCDAHAADYDRDIADSERERGEDDGREYGHPGDALAGRD
jgi:hypothetical protein